MNPVWSRRARGRAAGELGRRWHPLSIGAGLLLAAAGLMVSGLLGAPLPLAGWLLSGAAAGFATSGST